LLRHQSLFQADRSAVAKVLHRQLRAVPVKAQTNRLSRTQNGVAERTANLAWRRLQRRCHQSRRHNPFRRDRKRQSEPLWHQRITKVELRKIPKSTSADR